MKVEINDKKLFNKEVVLPQIGYINEFLRQIFLKEKTFDFCLQFYPIYEKEKVKYGEYETFNEYITGFELRKKETIVKIIVEKNKKYKEPIEIYYEVPLNIIIQYGDEEDFKYKTFREEEVKVDFQAE